MSRSKVWGRVRMDLAGLAGLAAVGMFVACASAPPPTGYRDRESSKEADDDDEEEEESSSSAPPTAPTPDSGVGTNTTTSCLAIKTATPPAKDGIYTIDPDGPGPAAAFPVYCDMSTDGGGWTLTARWAGTNLNEWSHQQVCGAAGNVRTQTDNPTTFPVPPDNTVAAWGTTCMVKPGNPTFIATFGAFLTYPVGALDGIARGVVVTYSVAGPVATSSAAGMWNNASMSNFSIMPATDVSGLCGGPDVCAAMACPSSTAWNGCHWDQSNIQSVFRR